MPFPATNTFLFEATWTTLGTKVSRQEVWLVDTLLQVVEVAVRLAAVCVKIEWPTELLGISKGYKCIFTCNMHNPKQLSKQAHFGVIISPFTVQYNTKIAVSLSLFTQSGRGNDSRVPLSIAVMGIGKCIIAEITRDHVITMHLQLWS